MVYAHLLTRDPSVVPAATDFIVRIEGVMGGRPIIRGTRITVASVKGRVSGGDSLDDLVADYPEVAWEAFAAAVAYDGRITEARPTSGGTRRDM